MPTTSQQQFQQWVKQGFTHIPVMREILADTDTPLSVYLKLANAPFSYLFESLVGGERWGRYSIIGLPCSTLIRVKNNRITVHTDGKLIKEIPSTDPLQWIEEYHAQFKTPRMPELPLFDGGLVGYFGYDTIRYIEPRLSQLKLPDPLDIPDILLMHSDEVVIFDNVYSKVYVVCYTNPQQENAFANTLARLDQLTHQLKHQSLPNLEQSKAPIKAFVSNVSSAEYQQAIKRCIDYIYAGDVMQVVYSHRLSKPFTAHPLNLYRALRTLNPSPYLYFLNMDSGDNGHIIGASPEILVRKQNNQVTVRPIAGTRPRGKTDAEDLAMEKELLNDPKELAEHLMLIDLGRNDVGRISEIGSVAVTDIMCIERYSHVMHIVSNVVGKLRPEYSAMDVLKATFPAGTLSGAPKIRAMEIIDELEPIKRGIYGGAVGYWAWNGNMDLAIAIRTGVIKENHLYVQAGGGIVADSIAENEWQETLNKAQAVFKAAEMAESGFDEIDEKSE